MHGRIPDRPRKPQNVTVVAMDLNGRKSGIGGKISILNVAVGPRLRRQGRDLDVRSAEFFTDARGKVAVQDDANVWAASDQVA